MKETARGDDRPRSYSFGTIFDIAKKAYDKANEMTKAHFEAEVGKRIAKKANRRNPK